MFFWADCHFLFWKAWVNGNPARIYKAFDVFKAVVVPSGHSTVVFRFELPFLAITIISSHVMFWLTLAVCILNSAKYRNGF